MTNEPVPQRLSDAERDEAATVLREHYEAGRLDADEFAQRLDQVLAARVAADLSGTFADLPAPHPAVLPASGRPRTTPQVVGIPQPWQQPTPYAGPRQDLASPEPEPAWLSIGSKIVWPVAIVLAIVTRDWVIWIGLAIVAGIVMSQLQSRYRTPPPSIEP